MIAFKFLGAGAVAPFTRFAWPVPAAGGPGAWVEARVGGGRTHGIHACRPEHLACWIDAELWTVELGGGVEDGFMEVVAPRARLLGEVEAWRAGAAARFAQDCARRLRERADASGLDRALHGRLRGLLGDAEGAAAAGKASASAYIAARAAGLVGGDAGFRAERLEQGRRLAALVGAGTPHGSR